MSNLYVLDSFALLAMIRDEPGGDLVLDLINQAFDNEISLFDE